MKKTLSFRANELDLERIEELKEFYAECWNCTPEEISTSDIITWSIGMLHGCKVEQNFKWITTDDLKYGEWHENFLNSIKIKQTKNN